MCCELLLQIPLMIVRYAKRVGCCPSTTHMLFTPITPRNTTSFAPLLGSGPVIKINRNQRYATSGEGAARVRLLAERAGVSVQSFVVRADMGWAARLVLLRRPKQVFPQPISAFLRLACTLFVSLQPLTTQQSWWICCPPFTIAWLDFGESVMARHRVLTGITTTGTPHLGNYVGAIHPPLSRQSRMTSMLTCFSLTTTL